MARHKPTATIRKTGRSGRGGIVLAVVLFLTMAIASRGAWAVVCTDCSCVFNGNLKTQIGGAGVTNDMKDEAEKTRKLIEDNFAQQQVWQLDRWKNQVGPKLMLAADHFVDLAMYQAFAIGTMLDSKQQIETMRLFNQQTAEAQRDYQPNVGMCIFGTGIRSLAAAERRGEFTRFALSQRAQYREMGHRNALGADGLHYDLAARLSQFKTRYCDIRDNDGQLDKICGQSAPLASRGADINYTELVDQPQTLNINFTDGVSDNTADEQDIFALADNLYANNLLTRIPESSFSFEHNQQLLIDLRAITAKRSVAENSFYSIVGMKSQGTVQTASSSGTAVNLNAADTAGYMKILLKQLGVPDADMDQLIGAAPSYFAQMNVLTKTIYQRPEFYTDLYDTPVNVERKSAAMMAIQLMQNFDLWESYLRQEAMLSVWLELDLKKYQDGIQNDINRLNASDQHIK